MRVSIPLIAFSLAGVVSATVDLQARKNKDRPDPTNLDHCPGHKTGDADKCTFESQSQGKDRTIDHIVGNPVENCKGGTRDSESQVGGTTRVSQTWKYGVSSGFEAAGGEELGVSFENSDSWPNTDTKTFSQTITISIAPGKKAAVIAKVVHHSYFGRVRINYGDPSGEPGADDYHYVFYANGVGSIQPTDDVKYDQKIIDCGEDF